MLTRGASPSSAAPAQVTMEMIPAAKNVDRPNTFPLRSSSSARALYQRRCAWCDHPPWNRTCLLISAKGSTAAKVEGRTREKQIYERKNVLDSVVPHGIVGYRTAGSADCQQVRIQYRR